MPNKKGRGSNPNSHGNRPRLGSGAIAKEITLASDQWATLKSAGNGNHSKGVRNLIEIAHKARTVIKCLVENDPANVLAQEVLLKLENLEE